MQVESNSKNKYENLYPKVAITYDNIIVNMAQ